MQVILKPPPENVQDVYLDSLGAIGIDIRDHDIRFRKTIGSHYLGAWELAGRLRSTAGDTPVHLLPAVGRGGPGADSAWS